MTADLDGETLDPRTALTRTQTVPYLRQVFDGGTLTVVDHLLPLRWGTTEIGRGTESHEGRVGLPDRRVSRAHAEIVAEKTGDGGARVRVRNLSRFGTFGRAGPIEDAVLVEGEALRVGDSILVYRALPNVQPSTTKSPLLGVSPALFELRRNITLVAPSDATVLVLGPTGAGKEVVAAELHQRSGRAGPLVPVNCGAIPDTLAESQLFGHKAGSFTGAKKDHPGYFEQAEGGTLFLDEVGELPLDLQPKLLRVLDERKVTPVGATRAIDLDVRLVAATNRPLRAEVQAGRFRGDLYARLAELVLTLPPLRERAEDVLLLFRHALGDGAPPLAPDLAWGLVSYSWPFNVRELKKLATEASVRGAGQETLQHALLADRLIDDLADVVPVPFAAPPPSVADDESADAAARPPPSRDELVELLRRHRGVLADVARETGRSRKQVYRWLVRHELDADSFRDG